jgi:hypothetical protein
MVVVFLVVVLLVQLHETLLEELEVEVHLSEIMVLQEQLILAVAAVEEEVLDTILIMEELVVQVLLQ